MGRPTVSVGSAAAPAAPEACLGGSALREFVVMHAFHSGIDLPNQLKSMMVADCSAIINDISVSIGGQESIYPGVR